MAVNLAICVLSTDEVALDFLIGLLFQILENFDFLSTNIGFVKAFWCIHCQNR
ncbi:Uncharacterised protein [Chlamydia trachomatis]|nr:Uncharacterised protein [Chlamydia trachomatis]